MLELTELAAGINYITRTMASEVNGHVLVSEQLKNLIWHRKVYNIINTRQSAVESTTCKICPYRSWDSFRSCDPLGT